MLYATPRKSLTVRSLNFSILDLRISSSVFHRTYFVIYYYFRHYLSLDSLQFVLTSIQTYGDKVDVIVLGLKLLNDVMAFVPLGGNMGVCQVFHVVMNCAQFYAPDLPEYYGVRKTPYRLIKSEDISATNSGKSKGSTPASTSTSEKMKSAKSSQKALDSIEVAVSQQSEKNSTPPIEEPAPPLTTLPPIPVTGWKGSKGTKNAGIRRVQLPVKVDLEPKILTSEERFSLLPVVPGIIFQAFSSHLDNKNKSKKRLSLMQIFATLYKYTSFCYENRKLLFELKVHDELCEIAFMCDGWPRALSYVGWILDSMYGDILACGTVHDLFVDEVRFRTVFFFGYPVLTFFSTSIFLSGSRRTRSGSSIYLRNSWQVWIRHFAVLTTSRLSTLPRRMC